MENFGQARLHARTLPGSENHNIQRQNGLQDENAKHAEGGAAESDSDEGEPEGGSSKLLTGNYQIRKVALAL